MTDEIVAKIKAELKRIEEEEQVTILYACESGSRAWGFESMDSDYDVRFIYLRRNSWYLSIQNKRDVIEKPINNELDISGWDAPKALALFRKSNPPLLEWLQSPIKYKQNSGFVDRLKNLTDDYYSPISCMYHYLRMAENNYRKYLKGKEVWTKKYFYVLRPILACKWIQKGMGVVPTEFDRLVKSVVSDKGLTREISKLLEAKRSGAEMDRGPKNPIISGYIDSELTTMRALDLPSASTKDTATLDNVFVDTLREVNGDRI